MNVPPRSDRGAALIEFIVPLTLIATLGLGGLIVAIVLWIKVGLGAACITVFLIYGLCGLIRLAFLRSAEPAPTDEDRDV